MRSLSVVLEREIETRDAKQVIVLSDGKITFHPDDRGFALITAKNVTLQTEEIVKKLQRKFSQEE